MLKVRNLSNVLQKRTLRSVLVNTQGTPYPANLDPSLRNSDGSFRAPLAADVTPVARTVSASLYQGGLPAGLVVIKGAGDNVLVATGAANERPFGLLANHVGGTLDEIGDENAIAAWYGPGSVYEVLAPAFNDTGLAAAYAAAVPGQPVLLYAGADGRLAQATALVGGNATNKTAIAELQERAGAGRIVVKSLI